MERHALRNLEGNAISKSTGNDRLLVSKSGQAVGRFKSVILSCVGIYLIAFTAWRYLGQGTVKGAQYNLLVGCMAFLVIGYRKLVYVSRDGVVRETKTWLTRHSELLEWGTVQFITVIYRGNSAMVFLERDSLGWKVLFEKDQIPRLKELFQEYMPEVEVNEISQ